MTAYEQQAMDELAKWQQKMQLSPSFFGGLAKNLQTRINKIIPEKIHVAITAAIKQMTRAVIFGSGFTTASPLAEASLEDQELKVLQRVKFYTNTAATEGAITGAGGILLGLADFPIWLTLKMKLLHEISSLYGYDVKEFKERIFILYIFQLTFSSRKERKRTYKLLENWYSEAHNLPQNINEFDWRTFQLEYRDYIDLAKLIQLIPGIGAPVGAFVNHRLTKKLGKTAMNAYRLRWSQRRLLAK